MVGLSDYRTESVTIASGGTTSGALDMQGLTLQALQMPATFTGSTITFQTSIDGSTYQALNDPVSNTALTMTVTQAKNYKFSSGDFYGWRYIKLVSSSTEGADRVILLQTRACA